MLLTMKIRRSSDMQLSMRVHIDGRYDGAVDVGYGCQLRAADPADYLDHNCRQQGPMKVDALVRSPVTFVRSWLGCTVAVLRCGTGVPHS